MMKSLKILLALLTGLLCIAPSYAQKSKATLQTEINTNFPDNGIGFITPSIARQTFNDFLSSWQQFASVNAQTGTTYNFVAADYGHLVTFNNAGSIAAALPQATGTFSTFNVYAQNQGAGSVTITPVTSTICGGANLVLPPNQGTWIVSDGTNYQCYGGSYSLTSIKAPVRLATTTNISLNSIQAIDGVTVAAGDRILVKNQSTASQNGIYLAAAGPWTLAGDWTTGQVVQGTTVRVTQGATNGSLQYAVTTANPITIGTTAVSFGLSPSFIQNGTSAITRTMQDKARETVSVKDFGAIGNGSLNPLSSRYATLSDAQSVYPFVTSLTQSIDWAATQAAINFGVTQASFALTFPGKGPYVFSDTIDCSADSTPMAFVGDAQGTLMSFRVIGGPSFNCAGAVFSTTSLTFKNLKLTTTDTSSGNLGFNIVNRQAAIWDHVFVFGYREGIKLTTSYAPVIENGSYFNGILGKAIYATDASFKGARIVNSEFAGNGISLSQCNVCVGPSEGVMISGNDFSTNYTHIQMDNANGVNISGNFFEVATVGSMTFVNTTGSSTAISIVGNTFDGDSGVTFQFVDGITLANNNLFNTAWIYDTTATRVVQSGNNLSGSATLGSPTYATSTEPFISSASLAAFDYYLQGGARSVILNSTAGGGDHSVIRSRESGASGQIAVGGSTDPSTYYDQTNHFFRSVNGGSTFVTIQSGGMTLAGSVPLKLSGSTSGVLSLRAPAIAGTNTLTFPAGTTDFSATGGTSQVVKQTTSGGAFTVGQLANTDITGLGTSSTVNTGTSGATIPLLNGGNTWSGIQSHSADIDPSADGAAALGTTSLRWKAMFMHPTTVATLTGAITCSSTTEGALAAVTDANSTTFNAALAGSGSNHVMAYCNGTGWTVH